MAEFINFYFIPGLILGSIYALGAIGITMTFVILRFANFAHGESMTLGVYFSWSLVQITGWHPLMVMPVAMILTVLYALSIDRLFYKPLRNAPVVMLVVASFGLMLMTRSVVQFFWGVQLKSVLPGIQRPILVMDYLRISPKHMMIMLSALALMFAVHYLLTYTKIGKAMRAMSDSPELAKLTGIDTEKVVVATWVVGAALACAAGVFLAIDTHVETRMGFKLLLPMFAAAILGGVGRPYGALAGGLIIGLAEEISSYPFIGT
ncbi:MAG: branched-chain amino acid ABC transporter permease, partial [Rhizobiales bacterium]|nr:branched-chain amino acid ABC transporter permease [Hyphomicrobiales bacterium]